MRRKTDDYNYLLPIHCNVNYMHEEMRPIRMTNDFIPEAEPVFSFRPFFTRFYSKVLTKRNEKKKVSKKT